MTWRMGAKGSNPTAEILTKEVADIELCPTEEVLR